MGFMDKAKKLAEQAQEKLDDAQKNFNQGQPHSQGGGQAGVRYDEHGRPVEAPPAGNTPPPAAEPAAPPAPAAGAPAAPTQAPATPQAEPLAEETPAPPPPPSSANNANPDPFKPIE